MSRARRRSAQSPARRTPDKGLLAAFRALTFTSYCFGNFKNSSAIRFIPARHKYAGE